MDTTTERSDGTIGQSVGTDPVPYGTTEVLQSLTSPTDLLTSLFLSTY